jgi:hypothetical protein
MRLSGYFIGIKSSEEVPQNKKPTYQTAAVLLLFDADKGLVVLVVI